MSNDTKKALIVVRLSRLVDASTSAQRQEEECRKHCELKGYEVIGVAKDLNVSAGGTTPFTRPELSKWVGSGGEDPGRAYEYDVIVFWRLDRLVRSMSQLWDLIKWCDTFNVALESVTESHFQTSSNFGKIIALLVGSFAELELEAIRERTGADQHHRIVQGKYRGALPSWGYAPVYDEQRGWIVAPDPQQVEQIHWVANEILKGRSLKGIAHEMNERGELTPRDLNDIRQGREPKGRTWGGNRLKEMITSEALLGYVLIRDPILDENGKPKRNSRGQKIYEKEPHKVVGPDNKPVMKSDPVLDREVFEQVVKEVKSREIFVSERSSSLLLHVVYCGVCGKPAYRLTPNNGRKPSYRCRSIIDRKRCSHKTLQVQAEYIENAVTTIFLNVLGSSVRTTRVWDKGSDNSSEIAKLKQQMTDIAPELLRYEVGGTAYNVISEQINVLEQRIKELEKVEYRPAGWKWIPTQETVKQWWDKSSVEERNKYLRDCGVKVFFEHEEERKRTDPPRLNIVFENYEEILTQLHVGDSARGVKDLLDSVPAGATATVVDGQLSIESRS